MVIKKFCLSVFTSGLSRLNHLTYDLDLSYAGILGQGQMPKIVILHHYYIALRSRSKVGIKVKGQGQGQMYDVQQSIFNRGSALPNAAKSNNHHY